MEISKTSDNSVKIKTKRITIFVDPKGKVSGEDVIIVTHGQNAPEKTEAKLIIEGAGEYEVAGVTIHASSVEGETVFDIFDESRLLLLSSKALGKVKNEEGYDAELVRLEGAEAHLSESASDTLILYGEASAAIKNDSTIQKASRVNLKKKEDVKGLTIYLG